MTNLALKISSTLLLISNLAHAGDAAQAYKDRQTQAAPASVLTWLQDGNTRFAEGRSTHGGYPTDARERVQISAQGQRPLAAVLSCIDSRTTPELTFDTSVGDLFTARVGANVINDDNCGGIKAACKGLQLEHMTQLLDRVKPAIQTTNARLDRDPALSLAVGDRVVENRRYIAEISHDNVEASVRQILAGSTSLREKIQRGEILLVPAVFNVDTGRVTFDPPVRVAP